MMMMLLLWRRSDIMRNWSRWRWRRCRWDCRWRRRSGGWWKIWHVRRWREEGICDARSQIETEWCWLWLNASHDECFVMSHDCVFVDEHCHLFAQRWVAWSAFMLNGIAIHANFEASFQTTRPTLISVCLVDHAQSIGLWFADILTIAAYRTLKESGTTIARINAIMLARTVITTNFARNIIKNSTWEKKWKKKMFKDFYHCYLWWNLMFEKIIKPKRNLRMLKISHVNRVAFGKHPVKAFFHEWELEMRKDRDMNKSIMLPNSNEISFLWKLWIFNATGVV